MKKEVRIQKIEEVQAKVKEIKDILDSIVWEPQEGQEEHFDTLNKAEKIALIGMFSDSINLDNAIASYMHWFGE